jgi:hypothetical protein
MNKTMLEKRKAELSNICVSPKFDTKDTMMSHLLENNRIWGFNKGFDAGFKINDEALKIALKALNKIDDAFGTDYCDGDTMTAHKALTDIKTLTGE